MLTPASLRRPILFSLLCLAISSRSWRLCATVLIKGTNLTRSATNRFPLLILKKINVWVFFGRPLLRRWRMWIYRTKHPQRIQWYQNLQDIALNIASVHLSRYLSVGHEGLILNTGRHSSRYVGLYLSKFLMSIASSLISTDFFELFSRLVRLVYRRARNWLDI